MKRASVGVFLISLASSSYYWQARDWNAASRLMLTYAIGDRSTITIDGLEDQTGDKARSHGHYYSDKGPGYSLIGVVPYLATKALLGLPDHPLGLEGFAYWPADYWTTLLTSGLSTAISCGLLTWIAGRLGCRPRAAVLVGLGYGLATPAFVYSTLAYGHQVAACALLGGLALVLDDRGASGAPRGFAAGLAIGVGVLVELSTAPVAVVLAGAFLLRAGRRGAHVATILGFGAGALVPAAILLGYNTLAFDSPFDLGYAHHSVPQFRDVHDPDHPLGLRPPDWGKVGPLLWGEYRGLLTYAPVLALAPVGWTRLARRGRLDWAATSVLAFTCGFLVNLSYPEWTGGWSTGPRLLVTSLPFAMIGVSGALASRWRPATAVAALLVLIGAVVIGLCVGVGGRFPDRVGGRPLSSPLRESAIPLWDGEPLPPWWVGDRFARNLGGLAIPALRDDSETAPSRQWLQFAPLWFAQVAAAGFLLWWAGAIRPASKAQAADSPDRDEIARATAS